MRGRWSEVIFDGQLYNLRENFEFHPRQTKNKSSLDKIGLGCMLDLENLFLESEIFWSTRELIASLKSCIFLIKVVAMDMSKFFCTTLKSPHTS